jgi:hypothetical protein
VHFKENKTILSTLVQMKEFDFFEENHLFFLEKLEVDTKHKFSKSVPSFYSFSTVCHSTFLCSCASLATGECLIWYGSGQGSHTLPRTVPIALRKGKTPSKLVVCWQSKTKLIWMSAKHRGKISLLLCLSA